MTQILRESPHLLTTNMTNTIVLDVQHPNGNAGKVDGFRYFWAYWVNGFQSDTHCQPCFRGRAIPEFNTASVQCGIQLSLQKRERDQYLYICGVGSGPKAELFKRNFHLPLRYEEGRSVSAVTYNGYIVTAQNAVLLQIPALPKDWKALPDEMTRCKNFQFAVEYFGYPDDRASSSRE